MNNTTILWTGQEQQVPEESRSNGQPKRLPRWRLDLMSLATREDEDDQIIQVEDTDHHRNIHEENEVYRYTSWYTIFETKMIR